MTDDINRPLKGGGVPRSPKRLHGRSWLAKRSRRGLSWAERKQRSHRYCPSSKER